MIGKNSPARTRSPKSGIRRHRRLCDRVRSSVNAAGRDASTIFGMQSGSRRHWSRISCRTGRLVDVIGVQPRQVHHCRTGDICLSRSGLPSCSNIAAAPAAGGAPDSAECTGLSSFVVTPAPSPKPSSPIFQLGAWRAEVSVDSPPRGTMNMRRQHEGDRRSSNELRSAEWNTNAAPFHQAPHRGN